MARVGLSANRRMQCTSPDTVLALALAGGKTHDDEALNEKNLCLVATRQCQDIREANDNMVHILGLQRLTFNGG